MMICTHPLLKMLFVGNLIPIQSKNIKIHDFDFIDETTNTGIYEQVKGWVENVG